MTLPTEKTCLVVDDSAVIRKVARRIIETLGFTVSEAEDGNEALKVCAAAMPEVILLDWTMPNMDGYAFLQALRQAPGGTAPKILFCTTENDVGAIARALRAGADEYIMKPFDRDILTAKLEQVGVVHADAA
ncbi:response regulator [Methylobacterium trifolii]|uniref:Chemotaxis protein CheY n=1 Tax=Methylobacterium trifolii TaxID=1003092 RepID=A0ABQ4TXR8_9HYPH|nr:response regulator [Methylobacterium trifolii]GJE58650.1 Chemotaxis protein CheY [Methylobacterium trifolii]